MKEHLLYLFVPIPEGASSLQMIHRNTRLSYINERGHFTRTGSHTPELPPGKWQLIATTDNVSEEQARLIVSPVLAENDMGGFDPRFKDYRNDRWAYHTAAESFASLLTSLGIERAAILKRTEM